VLGIVADGNAVRHLPDWLPGTKFKEIARRMAKQLDRTVELPYEFVKQQIHHKSHKTSYLSEAIADSGLDPKMEFSKSPYLLFNSNVPLRQCFLFAATNPQSPQMVRRQHVHCRRRHHRRLSNDLLPRHVSLP
jgi:hypothetical protein